MISKPYVEKFWSLMICALAFHLPLGAQTPLARGGYLLPSGYLSTQGSQIVDFSGNPMRIASIGWPGTDGPAGSAMQGLWAASYKTILDSIKQDGFNTVRIPWSNVSWPVQPANTPQLGTIDWTLNPDLKGLTTIQIFQKVVDYAGTVGLKVIFDHHTDDGCCGQQPNGLWIDKGPGTDGTDGGGNKGTVDYAKFKADWLTFAQTFAGNPTVIGFDLDNEPTSYGHVNWGQGGPTDILAMHQDVGNAIQAVNPDVLIIMEGPQEYSPPDPRLGMNPNLAAPEGDLTAAETTPLVLSLPNKVIYSVHEYPNEIAAFPGPDSGPGLITRMNNVWGYLIVNNVAPVWIGEMGSSMTSKDAKWWAATLLPYMNGQYGSQGGPVFSAQQQPVSGSWWQAGNQIGNPDGIQTVWGLGHYRPQQQAITDQMLFRPVRAIPQAPLSLYGYLMSIRTQGDGAIQPDATWGMSGGSIANDVQFSGTKTYTFKIKAEGVYAGGAWPSMAVQIDGTTVQSILVNRSSLTTYTARFAVTQGNHQVGIAFSNPYSTRQLNVYSIGIE